MLLTSTDSWVQDLSFAFYRNKHIPPQSRLSFCLTWVLTCSSTSALHPHPFPHNVANVLSMSSICHRNVLKMSSTNHSFSITGPKWNAPETKSQRITTKSPPWGLSEQHRVVRMEKSKAGRLVTCHYRRGGPRPCHLSQSHAWHARAYISYMDLPRTSRGLEWWRRYGRLHTAHTALGSVSRAPVAHGHGEGYAGRAAPRRTEQGGEILGRKCALPWELFGT